MGPVSDPIQSVCDLYRSRYNPYGACIRPHTFRMESVSGPIHSVWDLYRTPYNPHGIPIGPHAALMGFHSPRSTCTFYVLFYGVLYYFVFLCGFLCFSCAFPCSLFPKQQRTRNNIKKNKKSTYFFAGHEIPCGLYGVRSRSHADCMGFVKDPLRSVWEPIQNPY